jgi:hypothetical protein
MNPSNFEAIMVVAASGTLGYGYDNESNQSLTRPYIDLECYRHIGIHIPALSPSCVIYIQVSNNPDPTTFVRLQKTDATDDWNVASGAGQKSIYVNIPFRFMRIECGAAQSAARTFIISGKY